MEVNYSFKKGFDQVPIGIAQKVKTELMQALKIKSRAAWLRRLSGKTDYRVSQVKSVEEVFHRHGITNVWGE